MVINLQVMCLDQLLLFQVVNSSIKKSACLHALFYDYITYLKNKKNTVFF